ncbi:MAG TPA: L,D-transpeptidase [Candidatus Angelobacter sp.]
MRRHVENPERESLGPIAFFLMWLLALMALSAAAHGQEMPEQGSPSAATQQRSVANASTTKVESESDDQITLARFILISIPDRQLALIDDGQVIKTYPIAIGSSHTPSPQGDFKIISRVTDPTWTHKGKVVGPGKDNPVGSRWMGLSLKGYGIHGTNSPRSIGKAASHGCFRMGKKDVEELFKLVRVGDVVTIRGERDELVAQVFGGANGEVQVASATSTVSADAGQD